jgi:Amidohydrolase family
MRARRMRGWILLLLSFVALPHAEPVHGQSVDALGPEVRKYLSVGTSKVILEHVQVIDGTGAAPSPDRNITIAGGKITAISVGADQPPSEGTTILDLRGYSVMPGIIGMHDHLFYLARPNFGADGTFDRPALFLQMSFSAPRLYLANGVTTARTVGSADPYTDLRLKQAIEAGVLPGPHLDVTGPYLEGASQNPNLQMHQLTGPEDARQTVAYWADRGVTSFKAYSHITREELRAAVKEAHARGLKVTGHLCSVTYREAAEIGIDNLEHGFFANTELDPDKKPDTCSASGGDYMLEHMTPGSPEADRLITTLVSHHVAVTSTLPGTAASVPAPAGGPGSGRNRRKHSGLRRSARDRVAGGGRIHTGPGHSHRNSERSDLSRPRGSDRLNRGRKECGPGGDER